MAKNKTTSAFDRIGLSSTTKKVEEIRQKAIKERENLSLAYQLGFYVGNEIVYRFLPTLSVDSIKTNNNISVTCGEGDECRRLNEIWFEKSIEFSDESYKEYTKKEWEELQAYHKILEDKYLPKTVDCHFTSLNIPEENMADFKKGIGFSLWDCDGSHYSIEPENIEVKTDEDGWFTVITIKRT